jgi:hypothetical protein
MWLCVGVFVIFFLMDPQEIAPAFMIMVVGMATLHGFLIIPIYIHWLVKKLKPPPAKVNLVLSFFMLSAYTVSMALGTPLYLIMSVMTFGTISVRRIWGKISQAWVSMDPRNLA